MHELMLSIIFGFCDNGRNFIYCVELIYMGNRHIIMLQELRVYRSEGWVDMNI